MYNWNKRAPEKPKMHKIASKEFEQDLQPYGTKRKKARSDFFSFSQKFGVRHLVAGPRAQDILDTKIVYCHLSVHEITTRLGH